MTNYTRSSIAALLIPAIAFSVGTCGQPAPELPKVNLEAAATCYAATVAQFTEPMSVKQVNKAAHFLFLGAVNDSLASPSALQEAASLGDSLQGTGTEKGDASRYDAACAKRFPQTVAGHFKELPADSRDTRMMCYTLATSLLQTYQSSNVTPPAGTAAMQAKLDTSLMTELNADPNLNPVEVAGFAMRSMAKAAELGPADDVIAACGARYGKSVP